MRTWRKRHQRVSYHEVNVETLQVETYPPFDLFIKIEDRMTAFRPAGALFDSRQRQVLTVPQIQGVCIAASDCPQYQEYVEQNLRTIITRESLPLQNRVAILYQVATGLIDAVFAHPPQAPIIQRAARMAGHIVSFLQEIPAALGELLAVAAYDYSAAGHAVNVCFLSVALGQRIGIKERQDLEDLSVGSLLHDIGQTRISHRILRKRGPLTTAEYDLIKKAPWWGAEILAQVGTIRAEAFIPVLQHGERMDGTGYPVGLRGDDIHRYGRICAIAEAFDAITSKHVYRDAIDGFPALITMRSEAEKFDPVILETFIRLLRKQEAPTDSPMAARVD